MTASLLTQILALWLVEMAISTNHKAKIWYIVYTEHRPICQ